jgi:hypothetical protein
LVVRPGETNRVNYAFSGRRVVGRLVSEPDGLAVDWWKDDQVLKLIVPSMPSTPLPNRLDFATCKAHQEAIQAYHRAKPWVDRARRERTYQLEFEAGGSFHIEDVTPGKYELRIRLTSDDPGGQRSLLPSIKDKAGSLTREVVIPEGDTPFDLGTLVVPVNEDSGLSLASRGQGQ